MADRANIDLVLLECLAGRLNRSGGLLGATRGSAPGRPGGAEATPIFAELLSRASETTADLLSGL